MAAVRRGGAVGLALGAASWCAGEEEQALEHQPGEADGGQAPQASGRRARVRSASEVRHVCGMIVGGGIRSGGTRGWSQGGCGSGGGRGGGQRSVRPTGVPAAALPPPRRRRCRRPSSCRPRLP